MSVALLESAVAYARTSLCAVDASDLHRPTPCRDWDLQDLLGHMVDSLDALHEAAATGYVAPSPCRDDPGDLVAALRVRAGALLAAWTGAHAAVVSVAGRPLDADLLGAAGALEIAVHGWDVARCCGRGGPPESLALALLPVVSRVVTDADRPGRFAPALPAGPYDPPTTRLLAALGRSAS